MKVQGFCCQLPPEPA